jgi:hypothetical protein
MRSSGIHGASATAIHGLSETSTPAAGTAASSDTDASVLAVLGKVIGGIGSDARFVDNSVDSACHVSEQIAEASATNRRRAPGNGMGNDPGEIQGDA